MNPSVDDRLASMIRAVTEVILPALDGHKGLAEEQAHLLLGQLHQLRAHADLAPSYEQIERTGLLSLARDLSAGARGGEATTTAAARLAALAAQPVASSAGAARRWALDLGTAIDALIEAAHRDGDGAFLSDLYVLVIARAADDADRDRSWFAATGFEGPGVTLPPIEGWLR